MESGCRRLYLQLGFLLMATLTYGSQEFANNVIDSIGFNSQYCLGDASRHLIRFRKFRPQVVSNEIELWDYMENLYKHREIEWYNKAYFMLLYDFQKMYVDCLISINLGRGKRHAPSKRSHPSKTLHKTP